ncbi:MAG: Clp protease N-terminal domain-containing protein [Thermomicrobiales bacterium]
MADRFDKFTERARRVLSLAGQAAGEFDQPGIDAEHILLALIDEGNGIAARVMVDLGGQLPPIRRSLVARLEQQRGVSTGEIGLTPRAKRTIELAVDEARRLHHHYIGTEHLLLALTRIESSIAADVLREFGIDHNRAVARVVAILSTHGPDVPAGNPPPPFAQSSRAPRWIRSLWEQRQRRDSQQQPPDMATIDFTRFTERARRVLVFSQEEAQRFNHNYIGTEHLLIGLIREEEGVAARVLREFGLEVAGVRAAVEFIVGRGETMIMGEIGLTPRVKTVLALAVDEARRLHHHYIGTEHLLLGIVREGEGIAVGVMESKGVQLEALRARVIQVLTAGPAAEPAPRPSPTTTPPPPLPRTPEEIAQLRTPRGRLRQVIPIVQEQTQGNSTFVGVAIERYENIFVASWNLTIRRVGRHPYPHFAMTAEDDRGNHYRSFSDGGSGGSAPGQAFEGRFAYRFFPALAPEARTLTITIAPTPGRDSPDLAPATWQFTVAIPPLPEA